MLSVLLLTGCVADRASCERHRPQPDRSANPRHRTAIPRSDRFVRQRWNALRPIDLDSSPRCIGTDARGAARSKGATCQVKAAVGHKLSAARFLTDSARDVEAPHMVAADALRGCA